MGLQLKEEEIGKDFRWTRHRKESKIQEKFMFLGNVKVRGEYVRSGSRLIILLVLQFEFVVGETFGEKEKMS